MSRNCFMLLALLAFGLVGVMACEPEKPTYLSCGAGELVQIKGESYCVYDIIETGFLEPGFACPPERPYLLQSLNVPDLGICSATPAISDDVWEAVEEEVEEREREDMVGEPDRPDPGPATPRTDKVDILMIIDNSGSMCEEQKALREGFANMLSELVDAGLDFNIAVVTTDMQDPTESGRFQTEADGVMGPSCETVVDISGCDGASDTLVLSNRDSQYMVDGSLDMAAMTRDLSCRSTVGTRGNGFEMGLEAARTALDTDLRSTYNQRFLRDDAVLALFFVTDENDCSDAGRLDKTNGNICEWSSEELVPVEEYVQFFVDLKGGDAARVVPGGIFAADTGIRYEAGEDVNPSCVSDLGEGYAGWRYEAFLDSFQDNTMGDVCGGDYESVLDNFVRKVERAF